MGEFLINSKNLSYNNSVVIKDFWMKFIENVNDIIRNKIALKKILLDNGFPRIAEKMTKKNFRRYEHLYVKIGII